MINRAEIKERAKNMFQSRYWPSVGLFAIFAALTGSVGVGFGFTFNNGSLKDLFDGSGNSIIPPAIAIAFAVFGAIMSVMGILYYIFVGGPFTVSSARTGLNIYDGSGVNFKDVIFCFRDGRYKKSVGAMALYMLFTMLACFVVMIPLMVIAIAAGVIMANNLELSEWALAAMIALFGLIAGFGSCVPAVIVGEGLSLTPYLVADEGLSGMNAIRRSWELMRGHKWERFVLELSFFGWGLLTVLTWGIVGIFYVNPYMNVTYAGYYRELTRGEGIAEAEIV